MDMMCFNLLLRNIALPYRAEQHAKTEDAACCHFAGSIREHWTLMQEDLNTLFISHKTAA